MICASAYPLVFIQNLFMRLAENILLMQPLTFGGDCPAIGGLVAHRSVLGCNFDRCRVRSE